MGDKRIQVEVECRCGDSLEPVWYEAFEVRRIINEEVRTGRKRLDC